MKDFDLDLNREKRVNFPEIIYGEYKTPTQIISIIEALKAKKMNVLVSRLQEEKVSEILAAHPDVSYDRVSHTMSYYINPPVMKKGLVGVVSAGTSDASVVEETTQTLKFLGIESIKFHDIGVAGIHRLINRLPELEKCDAIIAAAGFEGALPSVLGGMVSKPIIAVPTSVGYGVSEGGRTALNAMLSSCANGILVVNIDNGVGAALASMRILSSLAAS